MIYIDSTVILNYQINQYQLKLNLQFVGLFNQLYISSRLNLLISYYFTPNEKLRAILSSTGIK